MSTDAEATPQYARLAIISEADGQTAPGYVMRRDLSPGERMLRAAKITGILFGIAFFTIFIPILHFILPPLFLLAGLVMGFFTWTGKGDVQGGQAQCAVCHKDFPLGAEAESWPKTMRCPHCQFTNSIRPQ